MKLQGPDNGECCGQDYLLLRDTQSGSVDCTLMHSCSQQIDAQGGIDCCLIPKLAVMAGSSGDSFTPGQGPKYIKIFINLPRSMDFEEAERSEPTQALELGPEDIREDGIIQLRYVKFQNVNSVTVSVLGEQGVPGAQPAPGTPEQFSS